MAHPPSPRSLARLLLALKQALGPDCLLTDDDYRDAYAHDDSSRHCRPAAVIVPKEAEQVATAVSLAARERVPVIARGAGSGHVGGTLPVPGSLVMSFECLRTVIDFSPDDRLIKVESGVITSEIDRLARTAGLFYPPDPGSRAFCQIGGNLATNAAGPRSLKYGATRDHVLALTAVTGTGARISTGWRTSKSSVGYDLTRLLVGSEGTLALITDATLRLVPAPEATTTLRATYRSAEAACAAVSRVMSRGPTPSALEFLDERSVAAICREHPGYLPDTVRALLLVEVDGSLGEVRVAADILSDTLNGAGLVSLDEAGNPHQTELLWEARRLLSLAVRKAAPLKIAEDVVVPVSALSALHALIQDRARHHHLQVVTFGHAGNGNLHVNILTDPANSEEQTRITRFLRELFQGTLQLGGTLSGEHGIGIDKREFLPDALTPATLSLMGEIKRSFDPEGILNPGKVLPTPCEAPWRSPRSSAGAFA